MENSRNITINNIELEASVEKYSDDEAKNDDLRYQSRHIISDAEQNEDGASEGEDVNIQHYQKKVTQFRGSFQNKRNLNADIRPTRFDMLKNKNRSEFNKE